MPSKTIRLSKLLDWYGGDFGASRPDMLTWLAKHTAEVYRPLQTSCLGLNVLIPACLCTAHPAATVGSGAGW